MDNNKLRNILATLGVLGCLFLAFTLGRNSVDIPKVSTEVRIDTLTIEKPVPYEVEKVRTEYVYVPTPADTVVKEVVRVDSVLVAVDVERRVYQDSSYRAVVSGPVIGDLHPTLESIDVYNKNTTTIIEKPKPLFRPYISTSVGKDILGIGAGVSIKQRVDIGVRYMRVGNDDKLAIEASYRF